MRIQSFFLRPLSRTVWAALLAATIGCTAEGEQTKSPSSAAQSPSQTAGEELPDAVTVVATDKDDVQLAAAEERRPTGNDDAAANLKSIDVGHSPPRTAEQHYEAGLASEKGGNASDAVVHYTTALELDPDHSPARKQLGSLLLDAGRFIDASVLYGQQVEAEPENPDAHNDWGVVLVRIGNLPEAVSQFREALQLKADHPDANYNLATALLTQGKVAEAMEHLVAALRIHPTYTDAYFMLGRAYLQQDMLDEAMAQFQHVSRLDPKYEDLDYQLGRVFIRQDNVKEAVRRFSEAVRREPLEFEGRYALGLALARYGNHGAAAAQFSEAVRLEPEFADAHHQLALALAELGRLEEAIAHNDTALSLRPEDAEALNNQAWILATANDDRIRNPKRALELAKRAKTVADYNMPRVLDTLAAAHAAAGEFDAAARRAEEAARWAADTDQSQMEREIRERLEQYRAGKPAHPSADAERGDE